MVGAAHGPGMGGVQDRIHPPHQTVSPGRLSQARRGLVQEVPDLGEGIGIVEDLEGNPAATDSVHEGRIVEGPEEHQVGSQGNDALEVGADPRLSGKEPGGLVDAGVVGQGGNREDPGGIHQGLRRTSPVMVTETIRCGRVAMETGWRWQPWKGAVLSRALRRRAERAMDFMDSFRGHGRPGPRFRTGTAGVRRRRR
jgi:hypothetical protein